MSPGPMGTSIPTGNHRSRVPGPGSRVSGGPAGVRQRRIGDPGLATGDTGLPRQRAGGRGIIYVMVLMSLVIMGIATAVIAPVWHTEVRRDKEAELLFRLGEYRLAIARYRADRGRPPRELKDLLEDRTQIVVRRYLRRLYRDPITGKDDWKVDYIADRTGQVLGIADIHSSSEREPIRVIKGKRTYKDW